LSSRVISQLIRVSSCFSKYSILVKFTRGGKYLPQLPTIISTKWIFKRGSVYVVALRNVQKEKEHLVCKLERGLYGFMHALRVWYAKVYEHFRAYKFN
jgi:hypothetical protein